MITIEEMYLRNAISGNISPQYEKVVEFPLQAHKIALVLMHHMGIMKKKILMQPQIMQKVHKYLLKNLLEITCRGCKSMQAMKWGTKIKVTTMHNTVNKSISEI